MSRDVYCKAAAIFNSAVNRLYLVEKLKGRKKGNETRERFSPLFFISSKFPQLMSQWTPVNLKTRKKVKSYLLRSSRPSFSNFDSFEFIQLRMRVCVLQRSEGTFIHSSVNADLDCSCKSFTLFIFTLLLLSLSLYTCTLVKIDCKVCVGG